MTLLDLIQIASNKGINAGVRSFANSLLHSKLNKYARDNGLAERIEVKPYDEDAYTTTSGRIVASVADAEKKVASQMGDTVAPSDPLVLWDSEK